MNVKELEKIFIDDSDFEPEQSKKRLENKSDYTLWLENQAIWYYNKWQKAIQPSYKPDSMNRY